MKNSFRNGLAAAAMATVGISAAGELLAADYTMKVGNIAALTEAVTTGIDMMAYHVEGASGDAIDVQHFPNGQLGNFREMAEQVQLGTLEMAFTTGGGIGNVFPPIQAFDLPYLVRDDRVARIVMRDEALLKAVRDQALEATGSLRLLAISAGGRFRSFYTVDGPIRSAEDLKGMKIRTVASPIQQEFVRALGASPTPVAWPELYTAFSTGVVDGTKNSVVGIMDQRFNDFVKYGVEDRHSYVWEFWWVNNDWWLSLPEEHRSTIMDGLMIAKEVSDVGARINEFKAYTAFEEGGGQVYFPTEEEMDTFRAVKDQVWQTYKDQYGDALLGEILAAVDRAEAQIARENVGETQ